MLAIAGDGSSFVTGQKIASLGKSQIATWKYNPDGTTAAGWPKLWPEDPDGKSYGVAAVIDGGTTGVFVVGAYAVDGQGLDIVVLHYDTDGGLIGVPYTYDNDDPTAPQHGDDFPVAASYINNSLWLTGVSVGLGTGTDYITLGVSATTGLELARARYDSSSHKADTAVDINTQTVFLESGTATSIVVTGTSYSNLTKDDIYTIEYQYVGAVLSQVWSHRYAGPDAAMTTKEKAVALALGPPVNGHPTAFICGSAYNAVKPDFLTVGYTRDVGAPDTHWWRTYNGPAFSDDIAVRIATAVGNTNVYVAGSSVGLSGTFDMTVVAYQQADGNSAWSQPYRSGLTADDRVSDLIVVEEGSLYVAGQWYNGTNYDYLTQKLSPATGDEEWLEPAIYNLGTDYPAALGFRRDDDHFEYPNNIRHGYVYVTGRNSTVADPTFKYATVKYHQTP